MAGIRCCKDCTPPKRHSGCHAKCEQYLKEKAEWEEAKAKMKANRPPSLTSYDFDEIAYMGSKRHKRRNRD